MELTNRIAIPNASKAIVNEVDDLASEHIRLYYQLFAERGLFEIQWQEIAELILPNDSRSFQGQLMNQGQKRAQEKMYDTTGITALSRFTSILDSLLTPHNQKWHSLHTDDPTLNRNYQVRKYFDTVNDTLFRERYMETANFVENNQQTWMSLGAYGTGALFTDQLWGQPGLRYKFITLGELYFTENHQGVPDKVYRHYRLTARQAAQKWPDTAPEIIHLMAKTIPETLYEFLHCVVPNYEMDPARKDYKGMEWNSYDISITGNAILSIGGYRTFPYAISRYTQWLQEKYGRSPAMDMLPTLKTLNQEKKDLLKQAHRVIDPIYLVHDDGVLNTMNARPGTVIPGGVTPDGRPLVHTLPTGNVQITPEIMKDDRDSIKDAFLVSLFQILVETPEMTATEVMERTKEKGILIAPTIGRQETYLSRVINREIDILNQQGKLPKMPNILKEAKGQYKIRYESPLAKMRRAEEASGFMRYLQTATEVAQATGDPTAMFFVNWEEAAPEIADIQGIPAKWINSLDKVKQMQQQHAQAQQQQALIQAGPTIAAMQKNAQGKGPGLT